ncbi:serine hydrolase domain-containing protein [Lapidilactobacillus mulanensis]|nr:serine hydrolase domain-containing protein [Lapidilactobacillus mulanensis]
MASNFNPRRPVNRRRDRRRFFWRYFSVSTIIVVIMTTLFGILGFYQGHQKAETENTKLASKTAKTYQQKITKLRAEALAEKQTPTLNSYFQSRLANIASKTHFLGVAQIYYQDKLVASWQSGYSNKQANQLNTATTGFEINSVQKAMTGALLMHQVELGRVKLSDFLSQYYPNVPNSNQITLRQMLNMISGLTIPKGYTQTVIQPDQQIIANDIAKIVFRPQQYNQWSYQPINYILLAGIIEKVSGQTYANLFQEQIIQKLNLKHTHLSFALPADYLRATGYNFAAKSAPANIYKQPLTINNAQKHSELGTGQVYMSAYDLYQVEKGMLNGSLISQSSRDQLFVDGSTSHYGGGLYNYANYKGANGAGVGFYSRIHISPDGKTAMVLLTNHPATYLNLDKVSGAIDTLLF